MDKRQMKKWIWADLHAALAAAYIDGKPFNLLEQLERTKAQIFKYQEPTRSEEQRWIMATYGVLTVCAGHAGL